MYFYGCMVKGEELGEELVSMTSQNWCLAPRKKYKMQRKDTILHKTFTMGSNVVLPPHKHMKNWRNTKNVAVAL